MSTNDYRDTAVRFALRDITGTDGIVFRACAERARSLHTAAGPVVDIGCGSGRSTRFVEEAARILVSGGAAFIITNTPEFYAGRWVSCDVGFPENRPPLSSGQLVKARLLPQDAVVSDVFWSDDDYVRAIEEAGLVLIAAHRPLADDADEAGWLDESSIAPYVMYEVRKP